MNRLGTCSSAVGLGVLLAFSAIGPASADIVVGNVGQGANVLFNNGVQTGTNLIGFTQGGTIVDFTGTTVGGGTTIVAQGGQARLEGLNYGNPTSDDLYLSSLLFSLQGPNTFNNLEFNINAIRASDGGATQVDVAILDNGGTLWNFNDLALGNGSNFFQFQGMSAVSALETV